MADHDATCPVGKAVELGAGVKRPLSLILAIPWFELYPLRVYVVNLAEFGIPGMRHLPAVIDY